TGLSMSGGRAENAKRKGHRSARTVWRENTLRGRLQVVHGVKRLGIKALDDGYYPGKLFPLDDGVHDLDRPEGAASVGARDAVLGGCEFFDQLAGVLGGGDVDNGVADGQFLFDDDPQKIPKRKPAGKTHVTTQVGQVLHDLAYGEQPDGDLEEAK